MTRSKCTVGKSTRCPRLGYRVLAWVLLLLTESCAVAQSQKIEERDATGQSAADFDNSLWTTVVVHRSTHRQGTSHSDAEASGTEAQ
jgi:hypothetical protein